MKVNGREFSFQIASDVIRDGIGVELNEFKNGQEIYVAEIFRSDAKKEIQFNTIEIDLPYEVILKLQEIFEAEIPKEFQE